MKSLSMLLLMASLVAFGQAQAQDSSQYETTNAIEELNPFDPNIEEILKEYDRIYEEETGLSPFTSDAFDMVPYATGCRKDSCTIWIRINKSTQTMFLYINGRRVDSWAVSTGLPGTGTPNMELHPNGRIYNKYTSSKFPGGDYNGLGNMPYAVFLRGGFAMHGTPRGNWNKLGQRASHGCIRMHPTNAKRVNQLIRKHGIRNTWVSVYN